MSLTLLGKSLGSLLGGGGKDRARGYADAAKVNYYDANAEQSRAQSAKSAAEKVLLDRQAYLGSDTGALGIAEIGAGTDNDLARMIGRNLRAENVPLNSLPGGDAQDFYPGYKESKQDERAILAQILAGTGAGDKSIDLQKIMKGVTENSVLNPLRGADANIGGIANRMAAFSGKAQDAGQGLAIERVNETPGIDPIVAALAALGKDALGERGNWAQQSTDRRDKVTADNIVSRANSMGGDATSAANNKRTVAGTSANNAADNAAAWKRHKEPGAKTGAEIGKARDDVRAQFNAEWPIDMSGSRPKGTPSFAAYEKSWLKTYGVNEADYYGRPAGQAPAKQDRLPMAVDYIKQRAPKSKADARKMIQELKAKGWKDDAIDKAFSQAGY